MEASRKPLQLKVINGLPNEYNTIAVVGPATPVLRKFSVT